MGDRRTELSLEQIYLVYQARFDIEHFFRFGKQKLLLTQFQTPDVEREESWWRLTHLAFAQLWLARHLTDALPRPWVRSLPAMKKATGFAHPGAARLRPDYSPVRDTRPAAQTSQYSAGTGSRGQIAQTTPSTGGC